MSTIRILGTFLVLSFAAASVASAQLAPMEELGKEIFFDKISAPAPNQACAECHRPEVGFTGAIAGVNAHGAVYRGAVRMRFGNRKPPTIAYASQSPVFHFDETAGEFVGGMFWDGRATGQRLWTPIADQALAPFLNPVEQNNPSAEAVLRQIATEAYASLWEVVWGEPLSSAEEDVDLEYERVGLAIAAYEASTEVNAFSSKYDAYWADCRGAGNDPRDCGRAEGEKAVLDPEDVLSEQEWAGLIEYGEYCAECHVSDAPGPKGEPPLFTDYTYANIGVPRNPENPFYDMDQVFLDGGTPINPLGDDFVDLGLGDFLRSRPEWAAMAPANDGKFKVPTLRNVDQRPGERWPKAYMHNGFFKSLEDVVHFYNTRDLPEEGWPPPEVAVNVDRRILEGVPLGNLELDEADEDAIVAFLATLTDGWTGNRSEPAAGAR